MTEVQIVYLIIASLAAGSGLVASGYQWALKRNGYVKQSACYSLHTSITAKLTYLQFLIRQITTREQQLAAEEQMKRWVGD